MFSKRCSFAISVLAGCILAVALAAVPATAKESKTISTNMDIPAPTSLGGKPVKEGAYRLIANGSTVMLKNGSKTVAEAPAEWKQSDDKASYSSVVTDGHGIKEFHFEGKASYIEVEE
ncbi:MAG: hypothetical protein ACRD5K_02785 [Candidatus Acidiferrales bacterium]